MYYHTDLITRGLRKSYNANHEKEVATVDAYTMATAIGYKLIT